MKGIEGRTEAILKMAQEALEETTRNNETASQLTMRLERVSREIDNLRELVLTMQEVMQDFNRAEWLTTRKLAEEMSVDPKTIWNWWKAEIIPGYQVEAKKHIYFDRKEVNRAIKKNGRVNKTA